MIPLATDGPQTPTRTPADRRQPASVETYTRPSITAAANASMASVVIDTSNGPAAAAAPGGEEDGPLRLAEGFAAPAAVATGAMPALPLRAQPAIVGNPGAAEMPAAHHVVRRQRRRRKQLNTAILLLVAVIVLAAILIWILQRAAGQVPATATSSSRLAVPEQLGDHMAAARGHERNCEVPTL